LNKDIGRSYKSCREKNLSFAKWQELIAYNLDTLEEMLLYTAEFNISCLRLSSGIIPFASKVSEAWDYEDIFKNKLEQLKTIIKNEQIRISMHPGQYTVLNSRDKRVVSNAIDDLLAHAKLIRSLGGNQRNKMVLHIGGRYENKQEAMKRFIEVCSSLPVEIREQLVLENDEISYSAEDVLSICHATGLPMVYDVFHESVYHPATKLEDHLAWIDAAQKTWKPEDGIQVIHYSDQDPDKRPGAHAKTIDSENFLDFAKALSGRQIDIILECKNKNREAEKLELLLRPKIQNLERIHAMEKYKTLAKSTLLYQEASELLKDKKQPKVKEYFELLERRDALPFNLKGEKNAAEHVFGYFKKDLEKKEKENFLEALHTLSNEDPYKLRKILRSFNKKYPKKYLLRSRYLE
ncbi:MAG: UV DNA damage repair endonuclease UvsE, partial [Eubacteriales bacterium]|nr:UV DNA damage repair endonuclease UvsE [Eubacteriales bacterium]